MPKGLNLRSNRKKFIAHGFFFSTAVHTAEPSTILPLIVSYFSQSNILIGTFSSLVRGGAVVMQLYMAFYAQAYRRVLRPLRLLFFFRLISWWSIGVTMYFFGGSNHQLTLICLAVGLFAFSFTAGFGTVLFHELLGKLFTNDYRGVTLANRQFAMGVGGILSGLIAGWILNHYSEPLSFALTFLISGCFMSVGYLFLGTVREEAKQHVAKREKRFIDFLRNATHTLKINKPLANQIWVCMLAHSYLLVLPFVIKYTPVDLGVAGMAIGSAVPLLGGSVIGNLAWARLASRGMSHGIIRVSFVLMITSLTLSLVAGNVFLFVLVYLLAGSASDGFRLAFNNLVLSIPPEETRPVYFAIQNNITSIALFFSIPGGALISLLGFKTVVLLTIAILGAGYLASRKMVI